MTAAAIEFENVSKAYGETPVLTDFSMRVEAGEFVTVIGRSGCGKTTVLKLVNGLLQADKGRVLVEGEDVAHTDEILLRRKIGYVIQSISLFPHMTVGKNVAYVPSLSRSWDKKTEKEEVSRLLKQVGLDPELANRRPAELSGGQRQRVGVARALAAQPKILLMDEPFGAIDEITRRALQNEIRALQRQLGITVLFVTHDIGEALKLGTRVMVMDLGRVLQYDTPDAIRENPANEFVRQLVG